MQKYVTILDKPLSKDLFIRPTNSEFKINGGLWGSKLITDSEFGYKSEWDQFIEGEGYEKYLTKVYNIYTLSKNAKIYECNTFDDFVEFLKKYSVIDENIKHLDIEYRYKHKSMDIESLLKDGYDALYVSHDAVMEARTILFSPFSDDDSDKISACNILYGFDIDSLIVMNYDIIENLEIIREEDK